MYTAIMAGIILAICAGLCWGVGELFTKSVLRSGQVGPLTAISVRTTIELPILWLAYWVARSYFKSEPRNWLHADASVLWKMVIGSGLIAGAGGMICFYTALSLDDVSRIKPIAFSIAPATAVILGATVLGEPMNLQKALAVLLILAGVILLTANVTGHAPLHSAPATPLN
jgi:transporter family protein